MLRLWSAKPQSLSSQPYCSASDPSSCICGFRFIFLWSFAFFYVPDYKSNICPLWKVYNEHKITKGRKRAGYKSAWMFWIHLHIMFLYIYKERQRSTGRKREEDWERKKDAWGCSRKCLYWLSSWFLDSPLHFSFYAVWIFSRINLCYFFKTKFFFSIITLLKSKSDHLGSPSP